MSAATACFCWEESSLLFCLVWAVAGPKCAWLPLSDRDSLVLFRFVYNFALLASASRWALFLAWEPMWCEQLCLAASSARTISVRTAGRPATMTWSIRHIKEHMKYCAIKWLLNASYHSTISIKVQLSHAASAKKVSEVAHPAAPWASLVNAHHVALSETPHSQELEYHLHLTL